MKTAGKSFRRSLHRHRNEKTAAGHAGLSLEVCAADWFGRKKGCVMCAFPYHGIKAITYTGEEVICLADRTTGYPSVDKPWLKYYTEEQINAELPKYKIIDYLERQNKGYSSVQRCKLR